MRGGTEPGCDNEGVSPAPARQARGEAIAAEITARLADPAFALPGALADRMTRSGHHGCRCRADPPRLHGPYRQWTRKKNGKTATKILTDDQAADYAPGSTTTGASATSSPNSKPSASRSPTPTPAGTANRAAGTTRRTTQPEHQPPDHVASTRLTCGQPASRVPFTQLRPKREDLNPF